MNPLTANFLFITGLHRSGTSLLHEIIRDHPEISGISDSGVPQNEGQHLQTIIPTARAFGGPGKFAFDRGSYMDETHRMATRENATEIFNQWSEYFDLSKKYLVEKSPPTIVRTRFFQQLFPESKFIIILRHPVAVAYATQKMSKTSISSLIEHSILAYEIFMNDMDKLNSVFILRYEDFVNDADTMLGRIFDFLNLDPVMIRHAIKKDVNKKYFQECVRDRSKFLSRLLLRKNQTLEERANVFGYSINDLERKIATPWLDSNGASR